MRVLGSSLDQNDDFVSSRFLTTERMNKVVTSGTVRTTMKKTYPGLCSDRTRRVGQSSALKIPTQQQSLRTTYKMKSRTMSDPKLNPMPSTCDGSTGSSMESYYCSLFRFFTSSSVCDRSESQKPTTISPVSSDTEAESLCKSTKSVRFTQVQLHFFSHTLGSHVVDGGLPLALGSWMASLSSSVDHFEARRSFSIGIDDIQKKYHQNNCQDRMKHLRIPAEEREQMLLAAGLTKRELKRHERLIRANNKRILQEEGASKRSKEKTRARLIGSKGSSPWTE